MHYIMQRFSLILRVILLRWNAFASDAIELSARQNFALWLAGEKFFAVGRAALAVKPRRVSHGLTTG